MSEKRISYLDRNFDDYKASLLAFFKQYYPDTAQTLNDASIGSFFIDMVAAVSDNLSYHIDRVYQETNIESAQELSSLYSLARSNGLKIPGPKGAMTEVEFSCELPVNGSNNSASSLQYPDWDYAPVIKKGTQIAAGSQIFEVMSDIDFSEQFDENGVSNRIIIPKRNSNGNIEKYTIKKLAVVVAGVGKIFKKTVSGSDIVPFHEIIIPDNNVMNIESIIFKEGQDFKADPSMNEFMCEEEQFAINEKNIWRYFEVDNLLQSHRWGPTVSKPDNQEGNQVLPQPVVYNYGDIFAVTKGQWKPLTQKFITEFTDNGYLKVIFGAGESPQQDSELLEGATESSKNIISRVIKNNALGKTIPNNTTMYIYYRVGGGASSNIAKGALTNILYLNVEVCGDDPNIQNAVKKSIKVINTIPSISGKDMPTEDEIRNMIKYNNAAQERCVTVKDYENRVLQMHPKYGCPFRIGAIEENNKIMMYLLGIDYQGHLTAVLPDILVQNISDYLSYYRSINDYIEIKSGRIINLSFEIDIYVDKNYNKSDVVVNVINTVKNYMGISNHQMGEDIFVGDLEKEISKVDGVINLIDLRAYNEYGEGYSNTRSSQQEYIESSCCETEETKEPLDGKFRIDLMASDGILFSENDSMMEIKYPEKDIKVRVKSR